LSHLLKVWHRYSLMCRLVTYVQCTVVIGVWFVQCTLVIGVWFVQCTVVIGVWLVQCTVVIGVWFVQCTVVIGVWFVQCTLVIGVWFVQCTLVIGVWFVQCTLVISAWFAGVFSARKQHDRDVFQGRLHLRVGFRNDAVALSSSYSNCRWKVASIQGICRLRVRRPCSLVLVTL